MPTDDRRMIEFQIPLATVSEASAREKKHPRRHVELIHQWPARRPRSASRVAIAAALLGVPKGEKAIAARLKLLEQLAPYECSRRALEEARRLIREEYGGRAPKVLDMFAGGGAIPLEAANLGCEAYAVELNPVAHIIELATCVYPQTYGLKLASLVEKWGKRVREQVKAEIGDLYPSVRLRKSQAKQLTFASGEEAGDDVVFEPIAYLWTRIVPCVDRECGAAVPLVRQTWLCRKDGRYIALKMVKDRKARGVRFEIVSADTEEALGFDPAGFSDRGDTDCPLCGATIEAEKVKRFGKTGRIGKQLMAVVGLVEGERGRAYLPAEAVSIPLEADLRKRLGFFGDEWPGPAGVKLPEDARNFWAYLYGADEYWKLFTDRQAVALLTFSRAIREAHPAIVKEIGDVDLATATITYLALAMDKLADNLNYLCRWEASDQITKAALSRQALPMIWDFAEIVPWGEISGAYPLHLDAETSAIRGLAAVSIPARCVRGSATDLPFEAGMFDAVVTDPPYYDNISYADLSDFFFVWLMRTLGEVHADHLGAAQTPKKQEATVVPYRHGGDDAKARKHYEDLMTAAFREAGRVLVPGGAVVVVYAHKTVAGWTSLVDALRSADCAVTEAWPLRTESDARLNARGTAALATSIFLAARKRTGAFPCDDFETGVLPAVEEVVAERVKTLWAGGVSGADLVVAVVGAALGPFTHYSVVRRANGQEVSTKEFLEDAQRMAIGAILRQVVRDASGKDVSVAGIDPISRLYIVLRMQFGEAAADYDVLKNLAIGALPPGMELDGMRGALMQGRKALLAKKSSKVQLRGFEERGKESGLGEPEDGVVPPLIDVLHRLLWLQTQRPSEVEKFVKASRADMGSVRLLAQALGGKPLRAEPRPGAQVDERTSEQRAIDTFLASYRDPARAASDQMGLFGGR